jgi:MscS family membrane protein
MIAKSLKRLMLLVVVLSPGLEAQLSAAPQQVAAVRDESSDDPLGRSTPRGTVVGFMRAADREDYDRAVIYLDTKQQGDLARELAQQLQAVLNRDASVDLDRLSVKPEGDVLDTKNPNRDLVGVAKTSSGGVPIWLERVQRGDNPPIWLFSRETLRQVPEVYEEIGSGPEIERYLPGWMNAKLISRPLWAWCIILIAIPLVVVLGSLFGRLLKPVLAALANRFLGRAEIDSVQNLSGPLRLTLLGILLLVGSGYAYTLLRRRFWSDLGSALVVFGATWLTMKVVRIANNVYLARLRRTGASANIALAGLLGRVFQIVVFIIGIFTALYLAGVNLTAALAGLGIGGLALAFAAQKTLENLFGGIMIISDRPVHIGDSCKIGDITGTVVDIGLRSTSIRTLDRTIVTIPNGQLATMNVENFSHRDKFWFHPTISLRHETTVEQMEAVLRKIRGLLAEHEHVESGTARARFIGMGSASRDVEISAYIFTADSEKFLAIQEELLLRILEIVDSAGTALAVPLLRSYVVQSSGPIEHKPEAKTIAARDP